jgi:hypothetical protein
VSYSVLWNPDDNYGIIFSDFNFLFYTFNPETFCQKFNFHDVFTTKKLKKMFHHSSSLRSTRKQVRCIRRQRRITRKQVRSGRTLLCVARKQIRWARRQRRSTGKQVRSVRGQRHSTRKQVRSAR